MLPNEIDQRQRMLTDYIKELAKKLIEETEVETWANKFAIIYADQFRHNYSDFFPILQALYDEGTDGNGDFLSNNIERIRKKFEDDIYNGTRVDQEVYHKFTRLSEHINLQISQLNYYKALEVKLSSNLGTLTYSQNELDSARIEWQEAKQEVDCVKQDLSGMTKDMEGMQEKISTAINKADAMGSQVVTVLGIFAAIVLAFSGGFSILSNAIIALASTEIVIYKLAFICLLTGFILFNMIFMLMYFIAKIIGKSIYAECTVQDCKCEKARKSKCRGIVKVRRRLPYVYYFNIVVVVLMVADVIIWEMIKNNVIH